MDPVKARFPAQPASVTAARRFVTDTVVTAGVPELVDDARLLVSELATNAVTHARTEFTVTVHLASGGLHVEVQDGGDGVPQLDLTDPVLVAGPAVGTEHGRGLQLLAAAASTWGYRVLEHGKVVWFRLEY
jgi:anti-sigma regulatory factor (Ser/Thr protein kinase)